MPNTVRARVDLGALRSNLAVVRKLCPDSRILAMVKADAYGHGLLPVVRALEGADGFGVARLAEALALRKAGITHRVVLMPTLLDTVELTICSEQCIDVTAHDEPSVSSFCLHAKRKPLRVWLKLDSGMHRNGLGPKAFLAADRRLSTNPGVLEIIHMTHFSSADCEVSEVMEQQLARFLACHAVSSRASTSLANSAALICRPETRSQWVRPGIMLYGENPVSARCSVPLRPVMSVHARIVSLRSIGPGEAVGYNERWRSTRLTRIATVGVGYGDGYPRHARNGTPVLLGEQDALLVGQVSMDFLTVDVTDCEHVSVGDEVTLWGKGLPASVIAECANTIPYELFTSLHQRVDREFT